MRNYTDTLKRGDKIGCYQIQEVLGRGGFAVTYLATDLNLDVEVAIKEYLPREITQRDENLQVSARKPEFAEDYDVGLQSFAREAKTLARFKHPHIVRVHQVLHENNTAYMVMDFEQGDELADILEKQHSLSEDELRNILFPILDGVEEIHRHGFVHRDIKPSNIYVRHNGSPVLIDFGAARYTMSETTQQLTAVVTVGYTPIEQYNVSEDAQGPWSDIYALAAVCYEAVTGEVPTDSVTRASASVTKGNDPLPSVRSMTKQQCSDDCLDAIDWGLRMEADDRPQVIAQWRDSFDGIFNPASAYIAQTDASIYSPHRVETPLKSQSQMGSLKQSQNDNSHNNASDFNFTDNDEMASIPLNNNDSSMDAGVISLDPDERNSITSRPAVSANHVSHLPAANQSALGDNQFSNSTVGSPVRETSSGSQRSKLERPDDAPHNPAPKRTLRDEIEFDESDWNYEPPKKSSSLKLLIPALGLAAVVGGSMLFVNNPDLLSGFGNDTPQYTTPQALELAQQKMNESAFLYPTGESALDYYQIVLTDDPNNATARAGVKSIESAVTSQIASKVDNGELLEANRLLTTAFDRGLQIATSPGGQGNTATSTMAESSQTVPSTTSTQINPIDTAAITPTAPTRSFEETSPTQSTESNTGIDNNLSPFIIGKLAQIEFLIEQKRFEEALVLYKETDKYIPDQAASRALLQKIQSSEAAANATTNVTTNLTDYEAANEPTNQPANEPTPEITPQPSVASRAAALAALAVNDDVAPVEQQQAPQRNSFIDATGPSANHLNQLRLAIENKDMDSVTAISQGLPSSRTQFLSRMFQRYDRLDVTINSVSDRGDSVSAKLNVSMFKVNESGEYYAAGKWNDVALTATRENGAWQKIRW